MKKIKIIALILALVMVAFTLAACGDESDNKPHPVESDSSISSGSDNGAEGDSSSEESGSEPESSSEESSSASENSSSGDSSSSSDSGSGSADATGAAAAALKLANELIGTEYKSGGVGPDEFDNSGFVYYIFNKSGYKMPRRISDMAKEGKEVGRNDLKAGDVLIFSNDIGGDPAFVAICAGNDQFISCNRSDRPTALQKFSNYYEQRFICGRRIG